MYINIFSILGHDKTSPTNYGSRYRFIHNDNQGFFVKKKLLTLLTLSLLASYLISYGITVILNIPDNLKTVAMFSFALVSSLTFCWLIFELNIFRPLSKIKVSLDKVVEDTTSEHIDNSIASNFTNLLNEITLLQNSVRTKQQQLTEARDDLELKVYRRTKELADSYDALKAENNERIKAEKEAEAHRLQLIKDEKLKTLGILSAGVAHEINNPNNFIALNTPILKNILTDLLAFLEENDLGKDTHFGSLELEEIKSAVPKLIDGISTGSDRIANIVNSLKRYAQKRPADLENLINANQLINNAMPLMENLLKNSTDNFTLELSNDLKPFYGDGRQIEQIIVNLLHNSCFALDSRDKTIILRTYNSENTSSVIIEVEDEGRGIPKNIMHQIQDPFFTTRREEGGTGLGLSIASNIAHEHNGSLIFESEPNKGTKVKLVLPAA